MNNKIIYSISAAVLAVLATSIQAEDFSYNYVEGAYESLDLDGPDGDIYRLSASYELTPQFNVIGEYAVGDLENPLGGSDLDFEESAIGLGYHTRIAERTDFTSNLKVVNQDIDFIGDDTGYGVGVGLRHKPVDSLELDANIDYIDVNDNDDTRYKVGARYFFNPAISAGVGYSTSAEDVDVFSGNLRWDY